MKAEWRIRLLQERDELRNRFVALGAFLDAEQPEVGAEQLELLRDQYLAMGAYLAILNRRIEGRTSDPVSWKVAFLRAMGERVP